VAQHTQKGGINMARRTALTTVGTVLLVCLTLIVVVRSTKGKETTMRVHGFPFVQIGKTYHNGAYGFHVLQDIGNGWVVAQSTMGDTLFVNLNQTTMLFPKD
jgi:hypothetical protein